MISNPFDGMDDERVRKIYCVLYDRLGDGGPFGWDWPTIRAARPALYNSMQRVRREIFRRRAETHESA